MAKQPIVGGPTFPDQAAFNEWVAASLESILAALALDADVGRLVGQGKQEILQGQHRQVRAARERQAKGEQP